MERAGNPAGRSCIPTWVACSLASWPELDEGFARTSEFMGPLDGIPVLVKDCIETSDVPTTFGDAFVYPDVQVVPPTRELLNSGKWTTLTFPTNTLIASQTWMPAISVPAGFTEDGLPVGLEFVAKPYDEPTLFRFAHSFEQGTKHRRPPASPPAPSGRPVGRG